MTLLLAPKIIRSIAYLFNHRVFLMLGSASIVELSHGDVFILSLNIFLKSTLLLTPKLAPIVLTPTLLVGLVVLSSCESVY